METRLFVWAGVIAMVLFAAVLALAITIEVQRPPVRAHMVIGMGSPR